MRKINRFLLITVLVIALLTVAVSAACAEHTPNGTGTYKLLPDCNTIGVIEYTCADCGETFTQKTGNLGHNYEDGVCTRCGTPDANASANPNANGSATVPTVAPKTADSAATAVWAAALTLSAFGMCILRRRVHN